MKNIGLIVEDDSDVEVVNELIPKIAPNKKFGLRKFSGKGCGKIQGKCLLWASNLKARGCSLLILIHDLDERNEKTLRQELQQALKSCPITKSIIVIPIREIEAWLLSDHLAIKKAMNIKNSINEVPNPQSILDPKKKLGEIVRTRSGNTQYYINAVHNKRIAAAVDISRLRRCASFLPFEKFIKENLV